MCWKHLRSRLHLVEKHNTEIYSQAVSTIWTAKSTKHCCPLFQWMAHILHTMDSPGGYCPIAYTLENSCRADWHVKLTIFKIFAVKWPKFRPKIPDLGIPSGTDPKEEKTCLGPIGTIMQNLTPIRANVAEIAVTGQETNYIIARRPVLRGFVAFTPLILLNVNLRHFYTITLLIHIVRHPCCVLALTSP